MKIVIDRFEGKYAICQNESMKIIEIEKHILPADAKEGTTLIYEPSNNSVHIDHVSTNERKARIDDLAKDIWK